ncbi:uncharacterized protein PHACADRAFT_151415 [Phanerochaete carnosa HHB-10118-sp]|uniref:EF-hand domain-containing protein n=1 Tax=Phanerochaete carnosa (strain HHB-10118-sp) TaxID=650164 RepID=K5WL35_PHACS|nr:uncharacterized protein PHACADRAFT_151415 [Phanerochaete carnosa HHB-10118-sp]EKM50987.1 hypothetical protein PHACADRAFT_151415 [Phanerochaete carnosa HHB-10118-sp]
MPHQSSAEALTGGVEFKKIEANIKHDQNSKSSRLMSLVSSAQDKLNKANDAISKVEDVAAPWDTSRVAVADLLAPVKDIVDILDCIAEVHPAVKVVAGVVKIVIDLELTRRSNDKQIAIVYFTMSSLLLLLSDLDPVVDGDKHLETCLNAICQTINSFGNFCRVYYRQAGFVKTLRSKHYKDKLAAYAGDFSDHKKELHLLLSAQSSLTIRDVKTEVTKIVALLEAKSSEEQTADRYVHNMGGLEAVVQDDRKLEQLARVLGERFDSSMKRNLRMDLDEILRNNLDAYSSKIDIMVQRVEASIRASTSMVLYKVDISTTTVLDQVDHSTLVILNKLEDGPHNLIEDDDLRAIWRTMHGRASVDRHMFLDALYQHFQKKFATHLLNTGQKHPDAWTLHFLSRPYFRPAIGDGIDEDCSGFISHTEANEFLRAKPEELGCSNAAWIAFWAVGPYKSDVEYLRKIRVLRARLKRAPRKVLPQNLKRVKHFTSMLPRIKLIEVLDNILRPLGELEENHVEYEELDKLGRIWTELQASRIRTNLDKLKYQIKGVDYVSVVLDKQRLENCILCMIHLLLVRHMKVLKVARLRPVAVREFEDMLDTWNFVFEAFGQRLDVLAQIWRQQRLELDTQVEYYNRGLFKGWYEREKSLLQMDYVTRFNANDDDQYYASSSDDEPDIEEYGAMAYDDEPANASMRAGDEATDGGVLLYTVPPVPEDESSLISEDEPDWEPEAVRKHKAEQELRQQITDMSKRLIVMEEMLIKLLNAQQQVAQPVSPQQQGPRRMIPKQRQTISSVRKALEAARAEFISDKERAAAAGGTLDTITVYSLSHKRLGTSLSSDGNHPISDGIQVLLEALTDVAKLYPELGDLVLTAKTAYSLESHRRVNAQPLVGTWLCVVGHFALSDAYNSPYVSV